MGGGNFSCTHPKLYKWIISNLRAFFIGGAISFVVTASATVILHSRQVRYKNDKSVETAINELYEKYYNSPKYMRDIGCEGCKRLEYLESTGEQYIDSNYNPSNDTKIILEGNYTQNAGQSIFGSNPYFVVTSSGSGGGVMAFRYNNNLVRTSKSAYEKSTIVMFNNIYINDELNITYEKSTFNSPYSCLLFARHNSSGGVEEKSWSKMYYLMIYDNDTLVRDYIPVLDKNNRPCMFDKVSKICFYNQGTGEFLYG